MANRLISADNTSAGHTEDPAAWQELFDSLEANQETSNSRSNATARPTCIFPMANIANDRRLNQISTLARLMVVDAHRLEREGDLDKAFDQLLAMLRLSAHLRSHQYVTTSGVQLEEHTLRTLRQSVGTRDPDKLSSGCGRHWPRSSRGSACARDHRSC